MNMLPGGTAQRSGYDDTPRYLPVYNTEGESVPAWGAMEPYGYSSEFEAILVRKPTVSGRNDLIFNGPVAIPSHAVGQGVSSAVCAAACTPAMNRAIDYGQTFGVKKGEWGLTAEFTGYVVVGLVSTNLAAAIVEKVRHTLSDHVRPEPTEAIDRQRMKSRLRLYDPQTKTWGDETEIWVITAEKRGITGNTPAQQVGRDPDTDRPIFALDFLTRPFRFRITASFDGQYTYGSGSGSRLTIIPGGEPVLMDEVEPQSTMQGYQPLPGGLTQVIGFDANNRRLRVGDYVLGYLRGITANDIPVFEIWQGGGGAGGVDVCGSPVIPDWVHHDDTTCPPECNVGAAESDRVQDVSGITFEPCDFAVSRDAGCGGHTEDLDGSGSGGLVGTNVRVKLTGKTEGVQLVREVVFCVDICDVKVSYRTLCFRRGLYIGYWDGPLQHCGSGGGSGSGGSGVV